MLYNQNFDSIQEHNKLKTLLVSLVDLYSQALHLPEVEPKNTEAIGFEIPVFKINFNQYDQYWKVFNPYHLEELVASSLSGDILDIYQDVKKGILLYEKNQHLEAIWEWKFTFKIHWGSQVVDAIRALNSAKYK